MSHLRRLGTAAILAVLLSHGALRAASDGTPAPVRPEAAKAATCNRHNFRLILDVGHTAEVPGATSARGAHEYDFNLRLAQAIKQKLVDDGFGRTALLVTAGPARLGLIKRVSLANSAPADLFLSIHHDSVPDSFLETWEYDGKESHFSDRFKGHSIFVSYDNPNHRTGLLFGRLLGLQLKERGLVYTPHYTQPFMGRRQRVLVDAQAGVYRYDQLIVLRMTRMPAVLLEAGSIINRDEELAMASPERQALIAEAVSDAVVLFCAARTPHGPERLPPLVASGAKPTLQPAAQANPHR